MAQVPTVMQSFEALFSAFPGAESADQEQAARAYLMAVEDIHPQFVAAAVKRFIRGEVAREKHTFLPSTAELAIEARSLEKQAHVAAQIAARNALPKPVEPEPVQISAEERARRADALMALAKGLGRHAETKRAILAHPTEAEVKRALADELATMRVSPEALERIGVRPEAAE